VDTRTRTWLLAGGAASCFLGTVLLKWVSVNLFFATVGVTAWEAGGIGPLAPLLAIVLALGVGVLFLGESAPLQVPPVALMVASGLLALLALLPIVRGQAGPGAFVTLVGAGVAVFAANGLRDSPPSRRGPAPRRSAPVAPSARFCGSCGAKQEGETAFCAQCGARLG
jgi:hypothetical protein